MTLVGSLKQIDAYIRGGSIKSLKRYMKYYDKRIDVLHQDFKTISIDDVSVREHVELILTNLGVPKNQWGKYLGHDLTVYNFLLMLSQAGYLQIAWLIELLDKKERINKMIIAGSLILPAGIVASALYSPPMEEVLASIKAFFSSADSLPIMGIVKTTIFSSLNLYRIFSDIKQPLFNRLRDAAFVIGKAAVNYVGYALWLTSAVTMTPVVAALFVASSLLDLGKEVFCLLQEVVKHRQSPIGCEDDALNTKRNKIRHEIGFKTHLNAAIINLVTAVAVVGIMAAWTFAPGGIVVAIVCIAALAVVYGVQYMALRRNKRTMREALQNQLACAETEHEELKVNTSELDLADGLANSLTRVESPEPGNRYASVPRESKMPSARSLPFFSIPDTIDDRSEAPAVSPAPTF